MFDQFRPIMKNGERYVVVEDGRPQYVLMRFHDYVLLVASQPAGAREAQAGRIEASQGGFDALNVELADAASGPSAFAGTPDLGGTNAFGEPPMALPTGDTTIRLEDLPL